MIIPMALLRRRGAARDAALSIQAAAHSRIARIEVRCSLAEEHFCEIVEASVRPSRMVVVFGTVAGPAGRSTSELRLFGPAGVPEHLVGAVVEATAVALRSADPNVEISFLDEGLSGDVRRCA